MKQRIFNYRLSRARRVVENAFGILAARFRIFGKPMPFSPDKVSIMVKTCCTLHNWLRVTAPQHIHSVDAENFESGALIEGSWRSLQPSLGLLPLCRTLANHPTRRAQDLRERLAEYFVGEGSVPWQLRMIM